MPATLQLPLAEAQEVAKMKRLGDLVQPVLPYQGRSKSREFALLQLPEALEKVDGNHCVEKAVAKKLKPLVVRFAKTPMGQGLAQQSRIRESVPQAPFQAW